jgi:DNA-binding NtrC family response regulator
MPKHTILLVDDDPSILDALSRILTQEHYNVIKLRDGLNAMLLLKKHQDEIHLVITDIKMPRMDGIELIRRMHTFLHTPMAVIILSGFYMVTNDTLKLGTGEHVILYDALLKPPDLNVLFNSIQKAIALTIKRRESIHEIDMKMYLSNN